MLLIVMLGVTSAWADDCYEEVKVDGIVLNVRPDEAQAIERAAWAYAFKLENDSDYCGDCCICGNVFGEYYIASPDGTQEYLVRPNKGLQRVTSFGPQFDTDEWDLIPNPQFRPYNWPLIPHPQFNTDVWAEWYEPIGEHLIKYLYAYTEDDEVYVVVFGK